MKNLLLGLLFLFCSCESEAQMKALLMQGGTDFTENLIAYYKMNDASGNMTDEINSYDFTASNITYQESGIIGDCFYFNGTNSYCFGTDPINQVSGDSVTLVVWVKFDTIFSAQANMQIWTSAAANNEAGLTLYKGTGGGSDNIIGGTREGASTGGVQVSTTIAKDTWYLLVNRNTIETGASAYTINVNNISDVGGFGSVLNWTQTGNGFVGRDYLSRYWMEGWVDDIALWDYWLSDSQVREYMKRGLRGQPIQ